MTANLPDRRLPDAPQAPGSLGELRFKIASLVSRLLIGGLVTAEESRQILEPRDRAQRRKNRAS